MESTLPSDQHLLQAIAGEGKKFQEFYLWLSKAMPRAFFDEVNQDHILLITHSLMGFHYQEYFSAINLKKTALVMCLDSADADLRILKGYAMYGIKNYQAYVSTQSLPFPKQTGNLRIAIIYFTEAVETTTVPVDANTKNKLREMVKERSPSVSDEEFYSLMEGMNTRFLRSLPLDRLILALDMFFRAQVRDTCQYEVRYNEEWESNGQPSMQIVLAWRNTPKRNFLYNIAQTIHRYGLVMQRVNATYIAPYSRQNILVMALGIHGSNGRAVWEAADVVNFLRELVTVKYFVSYDLIEEKLVNKGIIDGCTGNLFKAILDFVHQALVHIDPNLYSIQNIEEALCRHPELSVQLWEMFCSKFNPDQHSYSTYLTQRDSFIAQVHKLDTGQEMNDTRRKNVLLQAANFIHYTLKTNFFRVNYTALSFRLDPAYLDELPFDRTKKFPELPYGIFFIKGMHFFGFHIRFKDLARGGLRTVFPDHVEQSIAERNNIFTECYNLAYTQHEKNKDIPEGGSKAIIFLKPYEQLESEASILQRELEEANIAPLEIESKLSLFRAEQMEEYLYHAQRSFIESLITIINCEADGVIRTKYVIDYWNRPEYIYLGPDERMYDPMISWIAAYSKKYRYKPGSAFISGKPDIGINHKQYGVTSLGVNVYVDAVLRYLGINPEKEAFTVKMTGGPDGDVAGNEILNLQKHYPNTAKLVALTDGSGTIFDNNGLDLTILCDLFHQGKAIRCYPPEKLSEGGFLVDKQAKRSESILAQQTLCWRMQGGKLKEDWLSGSDMNFLLRHNVHRTYADIFIPGGGRPRTLNHANVRDFLDDKGNPTAKAIVEGANLYLTPDARRFLENLGVIIIKDSSANKAGVICSSYEVLCGLTLGDERFIQYKPILVPEILHKLEQCAANEAALLLETHRKTGQYLTDISRKISQRINLFTYQLLDYLDKIPITNDPADPMIACFFHYCPKTLREKFSEELLQEIPDHHKKAIISCHIAAHLVYSRGIEWQPSIVDTLPLLLSNGIIGVSS
jgi:glutamate dehydrogenase